MPHVLVIEPVGFMLHSIRNLLHAADLDVATASSGAAGLNILGSDPKIAVVLVAEHCKSSDARDILLRARRIERMDDSGNACLPKFILMLTRKSGIELDGLPEVREARTLGFTDVVLKPLDSEVADRIRALVEGDGDSQFSQGNLPARSLEAAKPNAIRPECEYRALVVDDEPHVRSIIGRSLTQVGFDCDAAANGVEAGRMLDTVRYDALVTDLRMPEMHGFDLCVDVFNRPQTPVVVVVTAIAEPRLVQQLQSTGVHKIAYKPFDSKVLANDVLELVRADAGDRARTEIGENASVG